MKKIIIAGGSGFLGNSLTSYFNEKGYKVFVLTRRPMQENHILWDAKTIADWTSILEGADALINLTGKSVDCRYNEKNKALILNSRVDSTRILGKAIKKCQIPPKVWMNAATATIYPYSLTQQMTEDVVTFGNDFSVSVAKAWEAAFNASIAPKTRRIILRTSIVMGKEGGAFPVLKKLCQFGLGGKQGTGTQKVSWIHIDDFNNAVEFLLNHIDLKGAFNMCAPQPIDNKSMMSILRKAVRVRFGLNQPAWLLKFGAFIIGTEPELILKSRNVIPKRLENAGFNFDYDTIDKAFEDLV